MFMCAPPGARSSLTRSVPSNGDTAVPFPRRSKHAGTSDTSKQGDHVDYIHRPLHDTTNEAHVTLILPAEPVQRWPLLSYQFSDSSWLRATSVDLQTILAFHFRSLQNFVRRSALGDV
ncbi:hypothetical protein MPTK1_6g08840 [Marchantia polymorpha subsp. ruderalis]|uniref:Uncharacterized protein n=2 Tax=Marchantia polymorpha TaxID=3197 RepID=A0AAF6BQ13_MARPO|nr:hypothetical protein MARPO_0060s0035 [Marchantia polymorpha]BBN14097.1 hypothetical protein Mp_6g08840 [Marchantia polymorpha subsp. ruderalis]|eukprot:PTQ36946.1 hypothetical protein MARPO_0060s0035 [Marchantia polymorpha]